VSFATPQAEARLLVNGRAAEGDPRDSEGRFWRFRARGLAPGRRHELVLRNDKGPLCTSWTLATLPPADAGVESFRPGSLQNSLAAWVGLPGLSGVYTDAPWPDTVRAW